MLCAALSIDMMASALCVGITMIRLPDMTDIIDLKVV
jgi:hypothetical protein